MTTCTRKFCKVQMTLYGAKPSFVVLPSNMNPNLHVEINKQPRKTVNI